MSLGEVSVTIMLLPGLVLVIPAYALSSKDSRYANRNK